MGETFMWRNPQVYHAPIHYNTTSFADAFYAFQMPHYSPVHFFSSGVLIFEDALEKLIKGKRVNEPFPEVFRSVSDDSSVVTTTLHYIDPSSRLRGRLASLRKVLDNSKIKIVPVSLGFNWIRKFYPSMEISKFPVEPQLASLLQDISARIKTIGCREEYSAEILNRYGIKNAEVIGCPSLFWHRNRNYRIERKDTSELQEINFNLSLVFDHISFIKYFYNLSKYMRVNYISQQLVEGLILESRQPELVYLMRYICDVGHFFLNTADWIKFMAGTDFTIGTRFHGCIASILAGVPALMITTDIRTEGMCKYFHIPYIDVKQFDDTKPIQYYYELADYSEFNKHFGEKYDIFKNYCLSNGLDINM